ncbi:hypothetical protein COU78_01715 [Candidatus Peregrinibacteria bacterium CG10_big_fil_rev_8_21_14_0_10_49_24]|nr:MAG: hypothetical protein COV83_00350 [Candidatus Peregrinibacteria bacterium CG11_big_fil_rev_8_21_14_0_20_49_14]PIR51439.1 MAG: hypothetical protein COU78_01715 [Candidatus Peregrinibacteria bacterium CG10_big_fil_rev_8_21_14_0_10_49_24]PJA67375.1 MAG: hypothetical protein CO157_04945 [Candidatus Peregrinibacteria bacterium CG_4_9_14_3_um_filter_49_12]
MHSLLFGISLSALLSTLSLLIVLLRVSPLTAPAQAIPAFFISLFLCVSTVGALALYGIWKVVPFHTWDMGKLLSISLRQGVFLGCTTVVILIFHLLNLLNWWIGLMIFCVFLFIELALDH